MAPIATRKLITQQRERANNISRILPAFRAIQRNRITISLVRDRKEKLQNYCTEFCKSHDEIITRDDAIGDTYITGSLFAATESIRDECNDELSQELAILQNNEPSTSSISSHASNGQDSNQMFCHSLHLPKIDLPQFTGHYEDWEAFENSFVSLIHEKPQISNVVKLQYLMGCLIESAADFVKDVAITEANYNSTWKALKERFSDLRLQIYHLTLSLIKSPPLKAESALGLRSLVDDMNHRVRMLRNLGRPVDSWDDLLVVILSERLDTITRKAWETYLSTRGMLSDSEANIVELRKRPPTFREMTEFLEGTIQALLSVESQSSNPRILAQGKRSFSHNSKPSIKVYHVGAKSKGTENLKCPVCSEEHYIGRCDKFKTKKPGDRHEEIRKLGLCFNSLGRHAVRNCQSKRGCKKCQRNHHTLLHKEKGQVQESSEIDSVSSLPPLKGSDATSSCRTKLQARALLDQGSEVTFISESMVQFLKLGRERIHVPICGVGSSKNLIARSQVSIRIKSNFEIASEFDLCALVLPRLANRLPSKAIPSTSLVLFRGLRWADPNFYFPGEIEMILGAEAYATVIKEGLKQIGDLNVVAQHTKLGWIFSGSIGGTNPQGENRIARIAAHSVAIDDVTEILRRFWSVEEVPVPQNILNPDDELCERLFVTTHSRDSKGRYIVRLPLKGDLPSVSDQSKRIALNSLMAMHRKFERDPTLAQEYRKFMLEYEELGHMRPVPKEEISSSNAWYLPHHAVIQHGVLKRKIRVVFDASRRTPEQHSLNKFLLTGPSLQSDLSLILTNWRLHRFVFTADIVKMFRQIRINETDQNL
ncbi:uncharacterized protein [Prorops nasuta]|uniref:uncharacterized protein n=1 Tax=Prorops nasuta TaxID=863751 RepID=UPI0034CE3970